MHRNCPMWVCSRIEAEGCFLKRILVVDGGSLHAQNVARQVRSLGVYSEIVPCSAAVEAVQGPDLRGIILVGMVSARLEAVLGQTAVPVLSLDDRSPSEQVLESFYLRLAARYGSGIWITSFTRLWKDPGSGGVWQGSLRAERRSGLGGGCRFGPPGHWGPPHLHLRG